MISNHRHFCSLCRLRYLNLSFQWKVSHSDKQWQCISHFYSISSIANILLQLVLDSRLLVSNNFTEFYKEHLWAECHSIEVFDGWLVTPSNTLYHAPVLYVRGEPGKFYEGSWDTYYNKLIHFCVTKHHPSSIPILFLHQLLKEYCVYIVQFVFEKPLMCM